MSGGLRRGGERSALRSLPQPTMPLRKRDSASSAISPLSQPRLVAEPTNRESPVPKAQPGVIYMVREGDVPGARDPASLPLRETVLSALLVDAAVQRERGASIGGQAIGVCKAFDVCYHITAFNGLAADTDDDGQSGLVPPLGGTHFGTVGRAQARIQERSEKG